MNPTSITTTATAALSATQGGQVIEWFGTLAHIVIPENVAMTLAACMVPLCHAIYNRMLAQITPSAPPTQIIP